MKPQQQQQQTRDREPGAPMHSAHARGALATGEVSDASVEDEKSDTDDEQAVAHNEARDSGSHGENDIDPDAQIEALDDDIIFGMTASALLSENEHAVKLTMQLIRESVRSASMLEPKSEDEEEEGKEEKEDERGARVRKQSTAELEEEQEIEALLQKKILRLDWLNIGKIENLDAFTHVQELYLQHNLIKRIENLDDHRQLTFLALGGNRIEQVEGLCHLTTLKFLDLSNNCIEDFDIREFPESLMILRLAGNPFIRHMPSYVHLFFERMPNLVQVDHFRRAQPSSEEDGDDNGGRHFASGSPPLSSSPSTVYSPRSRYVELEMEVELSHNLLTASANSRLKQQVCEDGVVLEEFDLTAYEAQRAQRMEKWKQQLKGIETRKAELEDDAPVIARATSLRSTTGESKRSQTLARARAATKTAIADSISHFQQVRATPVAF